MSRKNRRKNPWPSHSPNAADVKKSGTDEQRSSALAHDLSAVRTVPDATTAPAGAAGCPSDFFTSQSITPAQLAANRANAQLSTGPRGHAGLAKSSQNAVKSALTGRTVLLPTDDVEEYTRFLVAFQHELTPVREVETELVQTIVDCFWRLRRIQALEYALYAHGDEQFKDAFNDYPEADRYTKIQLQTHLTYEKQFRNYLIQEARLDRKRSKAMAELQRLQEERNANRQPDSEEELFACLDAGIIPPSMALQMPVAKSLIENGFVFSNSNEAARSEYSAACIDPLIEPAAA